MENRVNIRKTQSHPRIFGIIDAGFCTSRPWFSLHQGAKNVPKYQRWTVQYLRFLAFPLAVTLKRITAGFSSVKMIDWQMIDEEYSRHFKNKTAGKEDYPSSVAFGSLYMQRRLGLTDRELINQISENPYMQYFIGYKEFWDEKPFDASLLVTFRKRLPEDVMNRIIERMFIEKVKNNQSDEGDNNSNDHDNDDDTGGQDGGSSSEGESGSRNTEKTVNRGALIINATYIPCRYRFSF